MYTRTSSSATISPNSPMALAKISITRILTNSFWSCASASAVAEPDTPIATPQNRLQKPTVSPDQNRLYPNRV